MPPAQHELFRILDGEGLVPEFQPLDAGGLREVDGFIETGLTLNDRSNLV